MPNEPVLSRRTLLTTTGLVVVGATLGGSMTSTAAADHGGHHDDDPVPYTPYLFIRYRDSAADLATLSDGRLANGAVPPGEVFYKSPDIHVNPVDALGNPVAGTDVTVSALVFNSGNADAASVLVEFFWFNPSFALTAANSHPIGSELVAVPNHQVVAVECPVKWTPAYVNGGHECLVVHCSTFEEGAGGLKFPFNAALDRHVGQLNLNVSPQTSPFQLRILAPNQFTVRAGFAFVMTSTLVLADLRALRELGPRAAMQLVAGASAGTHQAILEVIDVTGTDYGIRAAEISPQPGEGRGEEKLDEYLRMRAGDQFSGRILGEVSLQPGQNALVDIAAPVADVGEAFLVHRFGQTIEGIPVGGYTAVTVPHSW